MIRSTILSLAIFLILAGCHIPQRSQLISSEVAFPGYEKLSASDRRRADSIVTVALNQEALYTLTARIKPVSSVGYPLRYPIAKDSLHRDGDHSIVHTNVDSIQTMLKELESWYRIVDALSYNDIRFVLVPFKRPFNGKRNLEILVCRRSLIDSVMDVHGEFFAQWGFTKGVDPATLLTAIEFEEKNDRYRAYGYLFGYPRHAVDFFVEASKGYDETKKFVERDFFHIPTFARPEGHFTYAIPKGYKPTEIDSAIHRRGVAALSLYKQHRNDFMVGEKLDAIRYLRATTATADASRTKTY